MATGSLDANGIWIYGEDDSEPTFSGLLNKLGDSTSDAVGTINTDITALESRALSGLVPINPVSVVVASGSATVTSLGQVSFTGATSLSLNNVFSSIYQNYRIIIRIITNTNSTSLLYRLRASGTDNTANSYFFGGSFARTSGATGAFSGSSASSGSISWINGAAVGAMSMSVDLYGPAISNFTTGQSVSMGGDGTSLAGIFVGHNHQVASSFDGITILPVIGNISGTIQVFGYND
jgi:hypothetical protein